MIIPPPNEVGGGVNWIHLVRPSVRPSDAFKFEIINYPDLSGNIPTKPAYGVFTSQVIRYARICSKKGDLLERVKSLTKKLLRKHYTINGLKSSLKKCLKKHRWITTKLGPRLHQNLTEE